MSSTSVCMAGVLTYPLKVFVHSSIGAASNLVYYEIVGAAESTRCLSGNIRVYTVY